MLCYIYYVKNVEADKHQCLVIIGMYQQLMEVMFRLDAVENDLKKEKIEHKEDVKRFDVLEKQNQKLRDENVGFN